LSAGDDGSTGWFDPVVASVAGMQAALVAGEFVSGTVFADAVVAETTRVLDAIDEHHPRAPDGGQTSALWEAELISALRVYRNAAFVFRRMAGADGEPHPVLATICGAMIEQGHDHWRALTGELPE
jgi:hypothetical protein